MPLTEAPWWAEQTILLLIAIVTALGVVASSWVQHSRQNAKLDSIEASAKNTEVHVGNGTPEHQAKPMRDELDKMRDDIGDIREGMAELNTDAQGLAATLRSMDEHLRILAEQDRATADRITAVDNRVSQLAARLNSFSFRRRRAKTRQPDDQ